MGVRAALEGCRKSGHPPTGIRSQDHPARGESLYRLRSWNILPQILYTFSTPRSAHLTLRRLMSYIYGAPILDVSRSHTTTQHSR